MNRAFLSILIGGIACLATQARATDLYMVGHQDDWPLFMGNKVFDQIATGVDINFIYLTAGDAGWKAGGWNTIGYFKARENGVVGAARFAASTIPVWYPDDENKWVTLNGHNIWTVRHRNTLHYFLRLPDGNVNGNGFEGTGYVSVSKLHAGRIKSITAVDGSTTYKGYDDLKRTVQAILNQYVPGKANLSDVDSNYNGGRNPDHYEATILAMNALDGTFTGYRLWTDYAMLSGPSTLGQDDLMNKTAMFGALCLGMSQSGYNLVYESWHKSFLSRSFYRDVPSPYTGARS